MSEGPQRLGQVRLAHCQEERLTGARLQAGQQPCAGNEFAVIRRYSWGLASPIAR